MLKNINMQISERMHSIFCITLPNCWMKTMLSWFAVHFLNETFQYCFRLYCIFYFFFILQFLNLILPSILSSRSYNALHLPSDIGLQWSRSVVRLFSFTIKLKYVMFFPRHSMQGIRWRKAGLATSINESLLSVPEEHYFKPVCKVLWDYWVAHLLKRWQLRMVIKVSLKIFCCHW